MGECSIPNHVHWQASVDEVDWQAVLESSRRVHAQALSSPPGSFAHPHVGDSTCGGCLRSALLMEDQ